MRHLFAILIVVWTLFSGLTTAEQTSAQTPVATTNTQAKPQTSPAPEIKDPDVKAFVERYNSVLPLFNQSAQLMRSADPDARLAAQAKIVEALQLSRSLYEKLNDKKLGEAIGQTGFTRPNYQAVLKTTEAGALIALGNFSEVTKDWEESIRYKKLAVAVIRELLSNTELTGSATFQQLSATTRSMEASTLIAIATSLSSSLNRTQEALDYANEALVLVRRLQQADEASLKAAREMEAATLQRMSIIYRQMDDRFKAIEHLKQALSVYQLLSNQRLVVSLLSQIGNDYLAELDYENALKYLREALEKAEAIGDKAAQAQILSSSAVIYEVLGNEPKLLDLLNRELAILLSADYAESLNKTRLETTAKAPELAALTEENDEFFRLIGIGNTYRRLKEYDRSLSYYEKALPIARSLKKPDAVQLALSSIAFVYVDKDDWQKALSFHQQSLEISRGLAQKSLAANDLLYISREFIELGKPQEAIQNAKEALLIYQSLGADREKIDTGYASSLNLIARAHGDLGNRRLAIFFEKQAVNAIQRERRQLKNLDPEAQRGYLKRNEKPYRRLADWLIAEGRFREAEQALNLLKEAEYSEYVRRDANEIKNLGNLEGRLSLQPDERKLIDRYAVLADRVTALGAEFQILDDKKRTGGKLLSSEQKRYDELNDQLSVANAAFELFLEKEVVAEFSKPVIKVGIGQDRSMQEQLRTWGKGVVALLTVAGEDRYRVILTTPKVQVDGKYEIKSAELNDKIFKFRAALQNLSVDPRPLGKELYDILIKPIEKDLLAANAKTLIWSLDGALRYIPLAALSPDGKTYLVEKYQTVVITSQTRQKMIAASERNWRVLGLGASIERTVPDPVLREGRLHFSALPGVKTELMRIVRDEQSPRGLLQGKRLVDAEFNVGNLEELLNKETRGRPDYTIVHLAGHFHVGEDNATSFLVLGDGKILTLKQVSNSPRMSFGNIELVTLSACNTAFGAESTGKEVDSLATFIELRGARAILATLWSVSDESTSLLMSEFYRLHKENPAMTKAAALQVAQQAMIQGRNKMRPMPPEHRGAVVNEAAAVQSPAFRRDDNAQYSHPYFWAPFVLIGNWK